MQKEVTLYNVLFPIWFLLIFPIAWLIVLPANFIIDSLVLLFSLKLLPVAEKKGVYQKSIIPVWLCGFAADMIGAGLLFLTQMDLGDWWYEYITSPVAKNPLDNWYSFFFVLVAIALAGFLIYLFNTRFCFSHTTLSKRNIRRLALILAFITAPYVLLIPSQLTYSPRGELQFFTNHIVSIKQQGVSLSLTQGLTKTDKEPAAYTIPSGEDRWVLRDGCNTAKKVSIIPGAKDRKANYALIFYNEHSETKDSITLPVWLDKEDTNAFISYDGNDYRLDAAATAKIREMAEKIKNGRLYQDFQVIDDGKEDGPAPEKIYSDLNNTYFLPSTRSRHIVLQFSDGTQMDLLKALGTQSISIESLMDKGLELVVKPKE